MDRKQEICKQIESLCDSQRYAVLATAGEGGPYASLVAFTADDTCRKFVFATSRSTRKFANLLAEQRVSLLLDNRGNKQGDTFGAIGVNIAGTARELDSEESAATVEPYLARHPHLREFVTSDNVAMIEISAGTYYVVNRFQEVFELDAK
jgi:nitroimidazol reductase NimA-like FMN-containing flavoprotein (pyridoxamine 5'-phosphate oxidase superfamily)